MKERPLKSITESEVKGKRVLVRGDLDVEDGHNPRIESVRNLVRWLIAEEAKEVKVIGHRETEFHAADALGVEFPQVVFDDTLRQNPGEKSNETDFARRLGQGWDIYVNEAFATSHRKHASMVALPLVMKEEGKEVFAGPRLVEETIKLSQVLSRGGRKLLAAAGVKKDKIELILKLEDEFDIVLVGGKLPLMGELEGGKIKLGKLRADGLDLDEETIGKFVEEIGRADVIVAAGVMGKYEDPAAEKGTRKILEAIAKSRAYKIAGGGDIETAIGKYELADRFDWISVGGGAMLEYLAEGTLVGIEALES